MPKENTHLFFAHQVAEKLTDNNLNQLVSRRMDYFYFGSVIPDSFYYAGVKQIIAISETLHGRYGNPTNEIIFSLLKKAKESKNEKDLVFALGYTTHCVLDMVFHPVIYYLSGNYYDSDPAKADEAVYLHRHLETDLDKQVNTSFFFEKLIKLALLKKVSFPYLIEKKFKLMPEKLEQIVKRKTVLVGLLRHDWLYYILYVLYMVRIMKHKLLLGIFYSNLKRDSRSLPEKISYRDIITGEEKNTTIAELFAEAEEKALRRINVANDYYKGKIHRQEAMEIIRGESLNTGRENCPVTEIKYFANL